MNQQNSSAAGYNPMQSNFANLNVQDGGAGGIYGGMG